MKAPWTLKRNWAAEPARRKGHYTHKICDIFLNAALELEERYTVPAVFAREPVDLFTTTHMNLSTRDAEFFADGAELEPNIHRG
jgi:hypothetical protein